MAEPHPILERALRELRRQKVRVRGPWHLGGTTPQIERDDAPRIAVFLLERSVAPGKQPHSLVKALIERLADPVGRDPESLGLRIHAAIGRATGAPTSLHDGLPCANALERLLDAPPDWIWPLAQAAEITASHVLGDGLDGIAFVRELDDRLMRAELERVLLRADQELSVEKLLLRWSFDSGHACEWWMVENAGNLVAISRAGEIHKGSRDDVLATLPEAAFRSAIDALAKRQ